MNDLEESAYTDQEDLAGGTATIPNFFPFRIEIPNDCYRGLNRPASLERSTNPEVETFFLNDEHRPCCPYDPSLSQISPFFYTDCLLPQLSFYHLPNSPTHLSKTTIHTCTPESPAKCSIFSADNEASISTNNPEDNLFCPKIQSAQAVSHLNQTLVGQSVLCNVNDEGHGPNHPSPIVHPVIYSTHSPEPQITQMNAVRSSQMFLPSNCQPSIHPVPSLLPLPVDHTFNPAPTYFHQQFQPPYLPVHSDAKRARPMEQDKRSTGPMKSCSCTKSQCLKLYCDCFANGKLCSNCNCINCCNNMEHEFERYKAIKLYLNKKKDAFCPKINKLGDMKGRHTKGCKCKHSGCLKNYCECFEAKIMCSSSCMCVGCHNFAGSVLKDIRTSSSFNSLKSRVECITPVVVEATCGCLLVQAEEAEKLNRTPLQAEQMILEEFGQCLTQIVLSIFKHSDVTWSN